MVFNNSFSVAMSVYKNDNPLFFDKALESIVVNQTIKPNEVVLIVDGPVSDDIEAVIKKYSVNDADLQDTSGIENITGGFENTESAGSTENADNAENINNKIVWKIIRFKENAGLGNALRAAVDNATNELIARMDSDDISVPDRFEQQLKYFENNPETDIVGGQIFEFVDNTDNIVGKRLVPFTNKEIREYMKSRCAMNHTTVMFKKSAIVAAGGYVEWFHNEDYYLWVRMCLNNACFANIDKNLDFVRVGAEMYKRRGGRKYYESEKRLQKYMREHKMIGYFRYFSNVAKRYVVEILLPDKMRQWVFVHFARKRK